MNPLTVWALTTLATYRLWRLIALDGISEPVRARLAGDFPTGWRAMLLDGLDCPWCAGWWCAVAVFVTLDTVTSVPLPVVQVGAASTVVGLIGAHDG